MSYASVAASGHRQSLAEASAPRPPELVPSEPASTGSLIDVDTPSVRTVPSDFSEQDIQTETQATRRELEGAAERARAEAHLAKKKGTGRVRRADSAAAKWFSELGNTATTALVVANLTAVVGLSGYVGYKAWGLYERGRVGWSNVGIGTGIIVGVSLVEGILGRYLYRGKKKQP